MLRSAARELRATVGCAAKNNVLLFPPLLRLSPVGDVASAVENVLAAYSVTTVAPHEYFDQTGLAEGIQWANADSTNEKKNLYCEPDIVRR